MGNDQEKILHFQNPRLAIHRSQQEIFSLGGGIILNKEQHIFCAMQIYLVREKESFI